MSNCKVIALTNQKGGVGKTTTAVNLGVSLVQQGKKVLLIDADAQANLTMALGYNRPDDIPITLSTVMQNIIDDKTLDASQGIIHHREGVDLLPSNIELSGFEVRLINAMSRERVLKTYVNEVKKNYDYVLIDCMPSLGMITINALAAADSVIIPTQPHYLSAKGLELLLRSVSMVKRQINPKLRIDGILMTMVMPRTNISKEITATVKSAYGKKIKVFDVDNPRGDKSAQINTDQVITQERNTLSKNYQSINLDGMDRMDERSEYEEIIKENLDYDILCQDPKFDKDRFREIMDIMLDAVCSTAPTIRINGEDMPQQVVKSRFLKLNSSHIEYVLEAMNKNPSDIRNIRAYLLTALYNASLTIDNYYSALVNHDFYGQDRSAGSKKPKTYDYSLCEDTL